VTFYFVLAIHILFQMLPLTFIRFALVLEYLTSNESKVLWVQFYLSRLYITDTYMRSCSNIVLSAFCARLDGVTFSVAVHCMTHPFADT